MDIIQLELCVGLLNLLHVYHTTHSHLPTLQVAFWVDPCCHSWVRVLFVRAAAIKQYHKTLFGVFHFERAAVLFLISIKCNWSVAACSSKEHTFQFDVCIAKRSLLCCDIPAKLLSLYS